MTNFVALNENKCQKASWLYCLLKGSNKIFISPIHLFITTVSILFKYFDTKLKIYQDNWRKGVLIFQVFR